MIGPPTRGCKKKLSKHHHRVDPPPPPKKKAIRVISTAAPAIPSTNGGGMCSMVGIPTATALSSSSSSSVSARTIAAVPSVSHAHPHKISRPTTRSTSIPNCNNNNNNNVNNSVIRSKQITSTSKKPARTTLTNGKSSTSMSSAAAAEDKSLFEIDRPIQNLYKVNERLGKGAYGVVWNAEEKKTGRKVALKKIFDAFRNGTDAQRTYREIVFLREFGSHPNIIRLLSVHKATNNLDIYLTFPLLDSDLHKVIKQGTPLKDSTIRFIFYQILKAVKFLHSAEVIHRDLKPANILLDKHNNVKVADFGLARSLLGLTSEHKFYVRETVMTEYVATRWYRPPEILLACPSYSKGVDIWGLGCILGEMLLRRAVFPGGTTTEQIEIIMSIIPRPSPEEIHDLCITRKNIELVEESASNPEKPLYQLFDEQSCDPCATDLVERLLVFHPNQRISVEEAISHNYLSKYRNEAEEITMHCTVSPPLDDNVQLQLNDYRSAIYELLHLQRPRPKTSIASARPTTATPRLPIVAPAPRPTPKPQEIHPVRKVRPGIGRKNNPHVQFVNDVASKEEPQPLSNVNQRLKSIKSSIASTLKNIYPEDPLETRNEDQVEAELHSHHSQFNNCFIEYADGSPTNASGSGDHLEYFPQMRNPSPYKPSSSHEGQGDYDHAEILCNKQQIAATTESNTELADMDISRYEGYDYDHEFEMQDRQPLPYGLPQAMVLLKPYDVRPHLHAAASEIDLHKERERDLYALSGSISMEENLGVKEQSRKVHAAKSENLRGRRDSPQNYNNTAPKYAESVRRLTAPLTRLPRPKEKLDATQKDLGLAQNLKEITPDWHYQGLGRGRQGSQSQNNKPPAQQQRHFSQVSQARVPPPKPPSRSTTNFFSTDDIRPRVQQHSSYFPDKVIPSTNTKRNGLGLPKPKQQQTTGASDMKNRRGAYESYTQTHGTISASELSELKSFTYSSKK